MRRDIITAEPPVEIISPLKAKDELLKILADRYLGSLTPGTEMYEKVKRLATIAGFRSP